MKVILDKIFKEITTLGGLMLYILVLILTLFIDVYYSLILFFGMVIIYAISGLIRFFYFRNRPKKMSYKTTLEKLDASSFPSIHAARVTFLAIFLIKFIVKDYLFVLLVILTWLLVCYSRIYLKKHYLIDVIGGVILGIVTSFFVM